MVEVQALKSIHIKKDVFIMKRIISIILALLMVSAFTISAYAEDQSAGTGESTILAHVYSHYTISIPATINLNNGNTAAVTATDVSLENGYEINVYVTNLNSNRGISLQNDNGNTATCMLSNIEADTAVCDDDSPLVTFYNSDFVGVNTESSKLFGLSVDPYYYAGDYSGIMQYRFECVESE